MITNNQEIRSQFPSMHNRVIYFDNPGGTQVPFKVMQAVSEYYRTANANAHGRFKTSEMTDQIVSEARQAMVDFFHAQSADQIVFGLNMTSLTFNISRSLGKMIKPGDEIIVTHLDHDANIAPWLYLQEQGAVIQWVTIHPEDCTLDLSDLERKINKKTKIIAVGYASNAVGSINNLKKIIALAHAHNALVYVDAVHYAPHGPIDVTDLDCDFLVCSAYKFYGPHIGILYGKSHHLDQLEAYKVRPSSDHAPEKFETGTQNFEGVAGLIGAIEFFVSIGKKYGITYEHEYSGFTGRVLHLKCALSAIQEYERRLFYTLIEGLEGVDDIHLYGITEREKFSLRTPTIAFTRKGMTPQRITEFLGKNQVYVWDGNYYALALMEYLGLEDHGGAVRVGLSIYNTRGEVNRFVTLLNDLR